MWDFIFYLWTEERDIEIIKGIEKIKINFWLLWVIKCGVYIIRRNISLVFLCFGKFL